MTTNRTDRDDVTAGFGNHRAVSAPIDATATGTSGFHHEQQLHVWDVAPAGRTIESIDFFCSFDSQAPAGRGAMLEGSGSQPVMGATIRQVAEHDAATT